MLDEPVMKLHITSDSWGNDGNDLIQNNSTHENTPMKSWIVMIWACNWTSYWQLNNRLQIDLLKFSWNNKLAGLPTYKTT